VASSCSPRARGPVEGEVAGWLGPDTIAVGSAQLDQIRAGPLSKSLPPAFLAAIEAFRQARQIWVAYNGKDLLVIAAGRFPPAPPGAILIGPGLALTGSMGAIKAAKEQYAEQQAGRNAGARTLLEKAEPSRNEPIWAVIRGDARLPLRGNSANLERMLQFTEYTAASARWDSGVRVELTGYCATQEKAQQLEESLRAMVTLGKKVIRTGSLLATLESIRIDGHGSTVLISLTTDPEVLQEMFR
jgi:hypothetical protein